MADQPSEQQQEMGRIIAKAWSDPAFKERLKADPRATLQAEGIPVPDNLTINVLENDAETMNVVLPAPPKDGEISEETLDQVAGGVRCYIFW